ncbi:MAG: hypothetical protein AAGM22_01495 [Acidobacteriota bacterium]
MTDAATDPLDPVNPYAPPTAAISHSGPEDDEAPALWNPDAAGVWSVFLTPVFGSFLIWKNWQSIAVEEERTDTAILWLVGSVFMLLPIMFARGLGFLWLLIWYFAWQRKQTRYIHSRWGKSYPKRSWFVPLGIGFVLIVGLNYLVGLGLASSG